MTKEQQLEKAIVKIANKYDKYDKDYLTVKSRNFSIKFYYKIIDELLPIFGNNSEDWFTLEPNSDNVGSLIYDSRAKRPYRYVRKGKEKNESKYIIDFISLYPNTMVKLHQLGVLKFNVKSYGDLVITLIKIRPIIKEKYSEGCANLLVKVLINYTYGILGSKKSKYEVTNFHLISEYCHNVFDMLLNFDINDEISEINIDEIKIDEVSKETLKIFKHILKKTNLPFEITEINK